VTKKTCPGCGSGVNGHPNKKFCSKACKDRYHNFHNPRGKYAHLKVSEEEMIRREKEADHNDAMTAQEASESIGGFFG
jgi:hypothetical protein